jgi:hypothetical protein
MCSPSSVSVLLYTQPCFEQLGESYFRYNPTPETRSVVVSRRTKAAPRLWEYLSSNPVPPEPPPQETTGSVLLESDRDSLTSAPETTSSSISGETEAQGNPLVPVSPTDEVDESRAKETLPQHEEPVESTVPMGLGLDPRTAAPVQVPVQENDREEEIETLPHKPESAEVPDATEGVSALEVFIPDAPGAEPDPDALPVEISIQPNNPSSETRHTPLARRSKLPDHPLHKRPIHQRVFFYLRAWLNMIFRRTA